MCAFHSVLCNYFWYFKVIKFLIDTIIRPGFTTHSRVFLSQWSFMFLIHSWYDLTYPWLLQYQWPYHHFKDPNAINGLNCYKYQNMICVSLKISFSLLIYPISGKIHFQIDSGKIYQFPPYTASFPILYRPHYPPVQIHFYK